MKKIKMLQKNLAQRGYLGTFSILLNKVFCNYPAKISLVLFISMLNPNAPGLYVRHFEIWVLVIPSWGGARTL